MTRTAYLLGWVFLALAVIERIAMTSRGFLDLAVQRNVLPRNFFELSLLFFVIAIASDRHSSKG